MASGKRGAGERILEGRHVIGLFLLMLLFSGVFFTLGYVMGHNQYDGQQVEAAPNRAVEESPIPKSNAKHTATPANSEPASDTAAPHSSDWEFYRAGEKKSAEDHLKPAPPESALKPMPAAAKVGGLPKSPKSATNAPLFPNRSYRLQVAAFAKESEALAVANNLQKKRFPAFVLSPQGDRFYRVQVGPYSDQKAAQAARKGLENAGFRAIVKQ